MLTIKNLSAGYQHGKSIIKDLSFSINSGEFVGIIGPNGAGKSTTIKAIMGHIPDTKGNISWIDGNGKYAYIPEVPIFYENLTLWEHLRFAASVSGINEKRFQSEANSLLKIFNMGSRRHDYIGRFSKGMQQKSMIMCGFI